MDRNKSTPNEHQLISNHLSCCEVALVARILILFPSSLARLDDCGCGLFDPAISTSDALDVYRLLYIALNRMHDPIKQINMLYRRFANVVMTLSRRYTKTSPTAKFCVLCVLVAASAPTVTGWIVIVGISLSWDNGGLSQRYRAVPTLLTLTAGAGTWLSVSRGCAIPPTQVAHQSNGISILAKTKSPRIILDLGLLEYVCPIIWIKLASIKYNALEHTHN